MKYIITIVVALMFSMCSSNKQIMQSSNMQAPLIIYKTTKDYSNHIPIVLNESRDRIVSYPSMTDIYFNGVFAKPTRLASGFLLDNFGISANSVYTSFTFEEYAKLEKVPSLQELMESIIDFDPFSDMYYCGKRNDFRTTQDINNVIRNAFENCKKYK